MEKDFYSKSWHSKETSLDLSRSSGFVAVPITNDIFEQTLIL